MRMKKHYLHNAIWYVLGMFTGGYVLNAVKKVAGKA
jgi:hypothetical protein